MTSNSEDSDAGPKRKRKERILEDSSSTSPSTSSGSPIIRVSTSLRRKRTQRVSSGSSSSDDGDCSGSPILFKHKRKIGKISPADSDSDSDVGKFRVVKPRPLESDSDVENNESLSSQWESDFSESENVPTGTGAAAVVHSDSDFSDGQSEKCPICLATFKIQEIGTPESCDHTFCLECIQEWSKNMNTCPVDRQEYNLILVRDSLNGRVIRQIPIERPIPQNDEEIFEDQTFCEICGSYEHEDRMLLCDGCDLGFHLYCLSPPLEDIPHGSWYCNTCSPDEDSDNEMVEIQFNLLEEEDDVRPRRRNVMRLIPRTRQYERLRRQIENNRHQSALNSTQSAALNSRNNHAVTSSTPKRTKKRKPRKKPTYRTVYEIDKVTGETVARKKRIKAKKTKKSLRKTHKPKTVKKRLAQQLGICAPRTSTQSLPDVKIPNNSSNTITGLRHSAGIPTLHIFGHNNELDYFSGEEEDYSVGSQLLTRRAPNHSDISSMHRMIRRKNIAVPVPEVSSTSSLLDSILNSQEQFYSRNCSYSLDSSGKFKVESKVDVNKSRANAKESPYYPPNRNYNNRYNQNYRYNQNRYQNQRQSNNYNYHSNNSYNSEPSSSMNYSYSGSSDDNNDIPQDYSQRTLCATAQNEETEDQGESSTNNANSDELDIYSDIETVSTSKAEENELKPPSPPIISHASNTDDDNNDSEPDMVIDDEKVQEQDPQNEDNKEDTAVTSTVGLLEPSIEPVVANDSMEIQSEAIQSSSLDDIKGYQYYNEDSSDGCPNASVYSREVKPTNDDDAESDDGCPNFSIYSKESKTLALHTDISLPARSTDYQSGEISSSPNIEEQNQQTYDPEDIYEPEQTEEPSQPDSEQIYDPEKIYDSPEGGDITYNPDGSYDPATCLHPDVTGDTEKQFDADQSYDPEKIYEEEESSSNDKTCDFEKEVFKYNTSNNFDPNNTTGDRYDPAVPFSDDLDESKSETQAETGNKDDNDESKENNSESDTEKSVKDVSKPIIKGGILGGLYSDSEDDSVVKKDNSAFAISDINDMTEDISEEERSYTPCLDEKSQKQGLEGLDTEMISDEERNDFDESHELKTVSDGDALEINAKESELDFTRPEDYEEGEIIDKNKGKEIQNEEPELEEEACDKSIDKPVEEKKSKKKDKVSTEDKENENVNKDASFKKLSKSTKERNYRDKEKRQSRSKERDYNKKEKKKEKRKELERYNVRAIIAEKPRPLVAKDQFGRDIRTTPSRSRSRSYTPPIRRSTSRPVRSTSRPVRSTSRPVRSPSKSRRSLSRKRKSPSKDKSRKRRKSKNFRSLSRSRSRSPVKKGVGSKIKKRKRSSSRFRKRKSGDRSKNKKRLRSRSRHRSASPLVRMQRDWERREWTPMSQSPTRFSPSWTPPRAIENTQLLRNENLTVTVNNSKKKKDKKRKGDKRNKDNTENRQKKRRHERERTPPPSKEVFASGDNILVSVSFNNENETRDISTRDKRKSDDVNKKRKEKKKRNKRDLSGIKPVAIIDLDRSPFREITPSPKQVIILTDSDNEDSENLRNVQDNICDSSQQVASPERGIGPKTPPEPQVKFSLTAKPPQIRAINNPLHDPEDMETNDQVEDEISSRNSPGIHIGPNTPPEPPNSPPSSPDAYDPFEPTKSRSPTPDRQTQSNQENNSAMEKSSDPVPEIAKSLTPPLADIQPADSQSSIQVTPDSNLDKSPDRTGSVQQSKPVAQTIPFSTVPTSIITSTPVPSNIPISRINILNSTIITPLVASSIPQRIVLPNQVKSSPVKISPTKATVKSTPIKPIPNKINKVTRKRIQNGNSDDMILDFDSPYSPGSSDYEDLFEPPSEIITKPVIKGKTKSPQKHGSAFDALFGGSPNYNVKPKSKKVGKKNASSSKTKTVGVKLDEDNLKILDDLPNSAVEMQVKDKFLKKLNRQERVVEEVKLVLKPHYNKKRINKEEYKDILRRSVPKICHNKSGEINPTKIKNLIEAYVRKIRHSKKVTSSSSVNPQKM